jgi:hypothetical protein
MELPHEEAVIPHCSQQSKNCLEGNMWPYSCKFTYEAFFTTMVKTQVSYMLTLYTGHLNPTLS